jgi:hypothetical protein
MPSCPVLMYSTGRPASRKFKDYVLILFNRALRQQVKNRQLEVMNESALAAGN